MRGIANVGRLTPVRHVNADAERVLMPVEVGCGLGVIES
jgi:hypothetical protein